MRVLQVLSSLNVNSGIANVAMNYYRNIDRENVHYDFLIFCHAPNNFHDEIEKLGGRIFLFTQPSLTTFFKAERELESFFKEHGSEYDIIHCHEILVAKMVFKYARKYGKVKCISHSHSSKLSDKFTHSLRNRIVILGLSKISDYCFACSKKAGQTAFGKKIIKDKKFKVLVNAINIDKYKFSVENRNLIRNEFDIGDKFVLGNVGRLSSEKNQKFAMDVLKTLLLKGVDAVLLLVGKGGLEDELRQYAQKIGMQDKIIFTGIRKDIPELLSAMDYFVFPSKFEGFGITLLEAQSNGLDCICFENMPEEIKATDKLNDELINSSSEKWAETILNKKESESREIYCKILKEKGFDIVEQAKNLKDIYSKIKEDIV